MREQVEEVAGELDEVMVAVAARAGAAWQPWQHVEWLRLQADLLDRLGAAFGGPGSCRAELLRDRAERMADRLNGMPSSRIGPPRPQPPSAPTHHLAPESVAADSGIAAAQAMRGHLSPG
ncbi:hypothetical protein AB0425_14170 [Actinosynnema sp. NPDC051121]|nr:hypothetical protein [Saccharothrix sp.]